MSLAKGAHHQAAVSGATDSSVVQGTLESSPTAPACMSAEPGGHCAGPDRLMETVPSEVRLAILRELVMFDPPINLSAATWKRDLGAYFALCLMNRQIRDEAVQMFFQNQFHASQENGSATFMSRLHNSFKSRIKELVLDLRGDPTCELETGYRLCDDIKQYGQQFGYIWSLSVCVIKLPNMQGQPAFVEDLMMRDLSGLHDLPKTTKITVSGGSPAIERKIKDMIKEEGRDWSAFLELRRRMALKKRKP